MGGGQTKELPQFETKKRVVIVGASFGGRMIVQSLQKLDPEGKCISIELIDKSPHFEYICSNYKAVVDEATFQNNTIDYKDMVKSFRTENVKFRQAKLTRIRGDGKYVHVELPETGDKEFIAYDVLCVCTGASYVSPWRAHDESMANMDDRNEEYQNVRNEINRAEAILCVGAGPTGVETASFIKEKYPAKNIAICQRGEKLLPKIPGAHDIVHKMLNQIGVNIHLETHYDESSTISQHYDYILDCRGLKYTGPDKYMQADLSDSIDKMTGQIFVNKYGQVTNQHPLIEKNQPETPNVYQNIFSFGDVCLTPMNEQKSINSMQQYAPQVANNIFMRAIGWRDYQDMPAKMHVMQHIPIGKHTGIFVFNGMVKQLDSVNRDCDEIEKNTLGAMRNDSHYIQKEKHHQLNFKYSLGFASGCWTCTPIHIDKTKDVTDIQLEKSRKDFERYY